MSEIYTIKPVNCRLSLHAAQVHFDAIRPISAIRYQYGDSPITAWLGPGKGTGATTGNGYRSYLRTMQHADYPSGSGCAHASSALSCLCSDCVPAAAAQHACGRWSASACLQLSQACMRQATARRGARRCKTSSAPTTLASPSSTRPVGGPPGHVIIPEWVEGARAQRLLRCRLVEDRRDRPQAGRHAVLGHHQRLCAAVPLVARARRRAL